MTIIFIFAPTWGDDPILLIFLSKGLKQPTSVDWWDASFFWGGWRGTFALASSRREARCENLGRHKKSDEWISKMMTYF